MTADKITDVDPVIDYVTVVADGAYLRFREGFVSLLFFQDKEFPSHDAKSGEMIKARTKREILHEVRLSMNDASLLDDQLASGLSAYGDFGFLTKNRNFWQPVDTPKPDADHTSMDRPDNMDALLWSGFNEMYRNCTKTGQEKMVDIMTDALHERIEDIRKVAEKYAKKKDKVYPFDSSKKSTNLS